MEHGILSNRLSRPLRPASVADSNVQDIRAGKRVPGGRPLHEYANLYFCARNPMLFKRLDQRRELCVLSVASEVIDLPGVVVTDGNAASKYIRFGAGTDGLVIVDKDLTFAEYWTHEDPIEKFQRTTAKCAEILIPDRVSPDCIQHAYVCNSEVGVSVNDLSVDIDVRVNPYLFFNTV